MRIFSIISILQLLFQLPCIAQQATTITLSDIKAGYKPVNFHIVAVQDKRANTQQLGRLSDGRVDLEGGVAAALMMYLDKNVTQDKNTLPVTMQLNRFDITEKQVGRKRQFDLNMGITYYSGDAKLVEYNGSSFAQSMGEAQSYIDKMIRENIISNFQTFDKWLETNKGTISPKPSVEVNVILAKTTDKSEHIPYTTSRRLTIADFKGRPDESSPGAAATMSGVGMEIESSTLHNSTKVSVVVSIYFDKSRSWMKENGKNPITLLHEQKHFDITALKACELKERIEKTTFTPEGYKTELRDLLRKIEDEGTEMQNTYDRETEHGTIAKEQDAWNKKTDELMSRQKCY